MPAATGWEGAEHRLKIQCSPAPHSPQPGLLGGPSLWDGMVHFICSASIPEIGPLWPLSWLSPAPASGIILCRPLAPGPWPLPQGPSRKTPIITQG